MGDRILYVGGTNKTSRADGLADANLTRMDTKMNKLVKGAIATGVGVVLLMGGAGTLAYWNAGASTGGATITAGNLSVAPVANGVWKSGATTIDPATFRTVPGDTLTYTQNVTLSASGDNLKFTVALAPGALTNSTGAANDALKAQLASTATYAVVAAGQKITAVSGQPNTFTVASAGDTTLTVTVTLTHAFQTGVVNNASQNGVVALGANALTFTQIQ